MELVLIIAALWGACFAVSEGTKYAGRRVARSYRTKVAARSKGKGKPSSVGVKVGAGLATAATSGVLATAGFVQGVKAGWPEGRRRGREWHEKRAARKAGASPEPETSAAASAGPESKPAAASTPAKPLRLVNNDNRSDRTAPSTSSNGGRDMAVLTATGGEVTTMQGLIAELESFKKEAAAGQEDAQADAARAKEDLQRVENMVASLGHLDLDRETLSEVGALREPAQQQQQAAASRATASERKMALADKALAGVIRRHQLMQEAHQATPHAADKPFYAG